MQFIQPLGYLSQSILCSKLLAYFNFHTSIFENEEREKENLKCFSKSNLSLINETIIIGSNIFKNEENIYNLNLIYMYIYYLVVAVNNKQDAIINIMEMEKEIERGVGGAQNSFCYFRLFFLRRVHISASMALDQNDAV